MLVQGLDRDSSTEIAIGRLVHAGHAAFAQHTDQQVSAQDRANESIRARIRSRQAHSKILQAQRAIVARPLSSADKIPKSKNPCQNLARANVNLLLSARSVMTLKSFTGPSSLFKAAIRLCSVVKNITLVPFFFCSAIQFLNLLPLETNAGTRLPV